VATATPQDQHVGAHDFGAALYATEGTKGLSVCDSQFSFGCFHEFLGRAIADLGLSSAEALNEACFKALTVSPLSCQHGIGHGVLAYLGYDDAAFQKSLVVCRDLPHNDPIGGCYGGVFMEYNLQTMLGTEGRLRPVVEGNVLAPCDSVDAMYGQACVFWQPQWWNITLKNNPAENGKAMEQRAIFAEMGKRCARFSTSELIRACYEGIGNIMGPEADFDPLKSKTFCELVSNNSLYQLYCKSLAANSLTTGGSGKSVSGAPVCGGLVEEEREYCMAYAENRANILIKGTPPDAP
jgi:hypothetical protein